MFVHCLVDFLALSSFFPDNNVEISSFNGDNSAKSHFLRMFFLRVLITPRGLDSTASNGIFI